MIRTSGVKELHNCIYIKMRTKRSNWGERVIRKLLAVRTAAVNKTLGFPQHIFCVISCFLRALARRHPLPKLNRLFPVGENASDMHNLLPGFTCVKGQQENQMQAKSGVHSGKDLVREINNMKRLLNRILKGPKIIIVYT